MIELPDEINAFSGNNEGFEYRRDDTDILDDLVDGYNQLIQYLKEQDKTK